jgi:uncharacterized lipoprotein YehR (DUF1307 family)
MKKIACIFSVVFVLAITIIAWAGCTMYEHADYAGAFNYIDSGREFSYVGDEWNDQVSAVKVSHGCSLTI